MLNETVIFSVCLTINRIKDRGWRGGGAGGGKKVPLPTSFSSVTSTNVGFGPKNFLTFSFNPFATLVQNFKFVPSASPKLLNLNQDHLSKKALNPYTTEVMTTFLIEMLVTKLWSHDHINNII